MKIAAIIAEYNPFHYGHLWQIRTIREKLGANTKIINVMSGEFTQRGEPAILDKACRSELAVKLGSDLVLELPLIFACAGAGYFAEGAVRLLAATGLKMTIFCGAETPDFPLLNNLALILAEEPPLFKELLQKNLALGESFAKSRTSALIEYISRQRGMSSDGGFTNLSTADSAYDPINPASGETGANPSCNRNVDRQVDRNIDCRADRNVDCRADRNVDRIYANLTELKTVLLNSNNILAIEYLKAIHKYQLGNQLDLQLLPRLGESENSLNYTDKPQGLNSQTADAWLSGTAIRHILQNSDSSAKTLLDLAGQLPASSLAAILHAKDNNKLLNLNQFSATILTILRGQNIEYLNQIAGFDEGLAGACKNILYRNGENITDVTELIYQVTSRRMPSKRINRAFIALILGINKEKATELRQAGPAYIRPLAFSKNGQYLLKIMRKKSSLPKINTASDFLEFPLTSKVRQQGELTLTASDICAYIKGEAGGKEFKLIPKLVSKQKF